MGLLIGLVLTVVELGEVDTCYRFSLPLSNDRKSLSYLDFFMNESCCKLGRRTHGQH